VNVPTGEGVMVMSRGVGVNAAPRKEKKKKIKRKEKKGGKRTVGKERGEKKNSVSTDFGYLFPPLPSPLLPGSLRRLRRYFTAFPEGLGDMSHL
jgi:hypothetical protein